MSLVRSVFVYGALAYVFASAAAQAEPLTYVEPEYGVRIYPGDEDARLGRLHLLRGHFGLAERYFRRAVEATPQNGFAWNGLGAAYDGLGRYDLATRAYRHAERLSGANAAVLNNRGYSHMRRGNAGKADAYFRRAQARAPNDLTIANNRAVLEAGQDYFWSDNFWAPLPLR